MFDLGTSLLSCHPRSFSPAVTRWFIAWFLTSSCLLFLYLFVYQTKPSRPTKYTTLQLHQIKTQIIFFRFCLIFPLSLSNPHFCFLQLLMARLGFLVLIFMVIDPNEKESILLIILASKTWVFWDCMILSYPTIMKIFEQNSWKMSEQLKSHIRT